MNKLIAGLAAVMLAGLMVPMVSAVPAVADQAKDRVQEPGTGMEDGEMAENHRQDEASGEQAQRRGPPIEMPGQVPEFVTSIHQSIQDYLLDEIGVEEMVQQIDEATPDNESEVPEDETETTETESVE